MFYRVVPDNKKYMMVIFPWKSGEKISLKHRKQSDAIINFQSIRHDYYKPYSRNIFFRKFPSHLQSSELQDLYSDPSPYFHVIKFYIDDINKLVKKSSRMSPEGVVKKSFKSMMVRYDLCKKTKIGFYTSEFPFLIESS